MKKKIGLKPDWTKLEEKYLKVIRAYCDAEDHFDTDDTELTMMQLNFIAASSTNFLEDLMRELATNPDSIEDGSHPVFKQLERDTFPYCLARDEQLQRCRRLTEHDGECRFRGLEEITKH